MPLLKNVASFSGAIGDAVTAAGLTIDTLTGNWTICEDSSFVDAPSDLAIELPTGEGGTIRVDGASTPFQSPDIDHYVILNLKAVRDESQALAADGTNAYLQSFLQGTSSTRCRHRMYLRNAPDSDGVGLTWVSETAVIGGNRLDAGSSIYPPLVPLDVPFQVIVHLRTDASTGAVRFFINGFLACSSTSANTASGNLATSDARADWTFTLPAWAGIKWRIGAPIQSWRADDLAIRPRYDMARKSYPRLPQSSAFKILNIWRDGDTASGGGSKGCFWSTSGTASASETNYATSGTNPRRRRKVISGSSTQTHVMTSVDAIGSAPWNERGTFGILFPRTKIPGGATAKFAIRNAADSADLLAVSISGGTVTHNSATIGTIDSSADVAVIIEIGRNGKCKLGIVSVSTDATSRYAWSFPLDDITLESSFGKVQQTITLGSSSCEVDGCVIGPRVVAALWDSTSSAPLTIGPPNYWTFVNNFGTVLPAGRNDELVPGGFYSGYSDGVAELPCLLVIGRNGRKREDVMRYAVDYLSDLSVFHFLEIDAGSINEISPIDDDAEAAAVIVDRLAMLFESNIIRLASLGNRFTIWTMLRRNNANFTATENAAVDALNERIREIVARLAPAFRDQITFVDVADYIGDHEDVIGPDGTHPDDAGAALWRRASVAVSNVVETVARTVSRGTVAAKHGRFLGA